MASIQKKGESWYCQFIFSRRRHTFAVGRVDEAEAESVRARVDYVLMRLKQGLMKLPAGADIVTFVQHDGRPPAAAIDPAPSTTIREFRDAYLEAFRHGAIESNSHDTAKIHLSHIADTLGERFSLADLSTAELQRHVDRRRKDVAGVTIKKEIDTFRSAWLIFYSCASVFDITPLLMGRESLRSYNHSATSLGILPL